MAGSPALADDSAQPSAVDSGRILLVDDEPNILSFVSRVLRGHGYQVDNATNGAQALELARTGRYALIVLDLVMPQVGGITALRGILADRPGQPVLVLSAQSDVESKVRCLELGAVDYMTKPFALAELLARVRTRLRLSAAPADERFLRVAEITLDLQRRVAETPAGKTTLSAREFALLVHLMRRAGEVCSKAELLSEVWGYDFDVKTNVVEVYVSRLRARLKTTAIETLRNIGYQLHPS